VPTVPAYGGTLQRRLGSSAATFGANIDELIVLRA
jgi:hypothetical protein